MKAKYIKKWYDNKGNAVLVYEYRNKKYDVVDYGWKGGEPLSWQHKMAQAHIDQQIEIEEKQKTYKTENAEKGLELFWQSVEME